MNILVLSPGRRVEIVQYLRETFNPAGRKVFTADMSPLAPALYYGDQHFVVAKDLQNPDPYFAQILELCKNHQITGIITLIDPEMPHLARWRERYAQQGIQILQSSDEVLQLTFDKWNFFQHYKDQLPLVPTFDSVQNALSALSQGQIHYPLFAKPRDGSASQGIRKIHNEAELLACSSEPKLIFQSFVDGYEVGVDLYFELHSGKLSSIFQKKKIAMRAGETDKAISIWNPQILELALKLEACGGFHGPVDLDVFVTEDQIYLNEINPRFGGGHPHAYGSGVNFMQKIMNNLDHKSNVLVYPEYEPGLIMLKYNALHFMREEVGS